MNGFNNFELKQSDSTVYDSSNQQEEVILSEVTKTSEQKNTEFYTMTPDEVRMQINGHQNPLSAKEVKQRQKEFGPNELSEGKKKTGLQVFFEQFKDFLVIILLVAAIVAGFMGDFKSTIVILVVVTINATLGTVQTFKAEQSLMGLKKLAGPVTKVLRDGVVSQVATSEVTIGDIVMLEAGDFIPADGRLLESASLKIDESAMTGESVGVDKNIEALQSSKEEVPLGDRVNMVYSGSFVTYGRGTFIVTNIGMQTEVGKIAGLLKETKDKRTPLQISLDQFGQRLSIIIIVVCAILFVVQFMHGESIENAFLFAVALAVAAIPEALSSIVTIVLSVGTQKMAAEHAIIRKLQAVEGLGSVSIICSDKTGTLTQNKMTVEDYYIDGQRVSADNINPKNMVHRRLLVNSILCNDSTNVDGVEIGDPTETALINLAAKLNLFPTDVREKSKRLGEIPFDSDRKLMSTINEVDGEIRLLVKGATDVITERITKIWTSNGVRAITDEDKAKIEAMNMEFSQSGLRVLGFAYKNLTTNIHLDLSLDDEYDLIFLGLISMMDPPREESAAAVAECISAGIRPIMITGDHKVTASAIAKRIGILKHEDEACEGAVIESMTDEELREFVPKISVYARVSPEHKIRIVRAWQDLDNIVSMTGDGVNDAPALKQADIGVAMGITGSEVSKDASSMVLTDDNFATIVKAVENGRNLYGNIKRAIEFLLSGNFAGIIAVLYASVMNLPVPFAPVHLLFINLLTDSLPAIALGMEPHSKAVMLQKPRPRRESILTKDFLIKVGTQGLSIATMTMIAFYIGLQQNPLLGSTLAFATLCTSRLVHGFNEKSDKPIIFSKRFFNNPYLFGAFFLGLALITAVVMIPGLHFIFAVQTLTWQQLLIVYGLSLANLPIIQLMKGIQWKLTRS